MTESATSQLFLYSRQYDFDTFLFTPSPIVAMLFVPRSGSTLLACLLEQTKLLGFPLEYFADVNVEHMKQRFNDESKSYIEQLFSVRTSLNGFFSYKLSADILDRPLDPLVRHPDYIIVVDRDNQLAQAKSYAKAHLTQEWVLKNGSKSLYPNLEITQAQIEQSMSVLQDQRSKINTFASATGGKIFRCSFEGITQNPQEAVNGVLGFCGIKDRVLVDITKVPIAKQS